MIKVGRFRINVGLSLLDLGKTVGLSLLDLAKEFWIKLVRLREIVELGLLDLG